jgi:hypothetical protein
MVALAALCHFQSDLSRSSLEHSGWFFGGCGAAVLAATFPGLGIGFAGVALAFGLTVLTMAFAIGHISGCHMNPAVSVGLVVGKRFPVSELPAYVIVQVLGGIAGSAVLYFIASGKEGFSLSNGFAANGYGAHCNRQARTAGIRSDSNRAGTHADPLDWDSGDQPVGESSAQHGSGDLRECSRRDMQVLEKRQILTSQLDLAGGCRHVGHQAGIGSEVRDLRVFDRANGFDRADGGAGFHDQAQVVARPFQFVHDVGNPAGV